MNKTISTTAILAMTLAAEALAADRDPSPIVQPIPADAAWVEIRTILLVRDLRGYDKNVYSAKEGVLVGKRIKLPGPTQELYARLKRFLHKTVSYQVLSDIKAEIFSFYKEHGHPMVVVEVPEQEISGGVVAFIIRESRVGEVVFTGNKWFSTEALKSYLDLKRGSTIDEGQMLNDCAWLNNNPFRHTDYIFSPGAKRGTTDVEVITQDRLPLRVYAGIDDTGVEVTGKERVFTGFTWGSAFGINNILNLQYTASLDFTQFQSYFGNYTLFLPWKNQLTMYGGFATIHPDIDHFEHSGKDIQGSFRYDIPFKPLYKDFRNEISFGGDFKRMNSDLFFLGNFSDGTPVTVPVFTKQCNLTQFYLAYKLETTTGRHKVVFQLETFTSPGSWLSDQTDSHYDNLRPNAKVKYVYGRLRLGDIYTMPSKWAVAGLLRLQGASAPLLPSEQFGLGGFDTVRGYDEREFNADNALCAGLEFRTPPINFGKKIPNQLYFLAFTDYGWGHNIRSSPYEETSTFLWSAGPGVRYVINPYLLLRVDYGFRFHQIDFENKNIGRWHFGATAAY